MAVQNYYVLLLRTTLYFNKKTKMIPTNNQCLICENKSCASKLLNEIELNNLSQNVRTLLIDKGETVLFEGSFTSHVIYLRKGLVKETMKINGKEQIFRIFKNKTYLGLSSLFGDKVNHFSYVALTDVEVCHIDGDTFNKFLLENTRFAYQIMSTMCKENLFSYDKLLKLGHKKIFGRLADVLLFFSLTVFESEQFVLPLSHQEIASFVGISRESITRGLSSLKQSGVISMENSLVKIKNMDKLKDISKNG